MCVAVFDVIHRAHESTRGVQRLAPCATAAADVLLAFMDGRDVPRFVAGH
jgi:hypothetical protein